MSASDAEGAAPRDDTEQRREALRRIAEARVKTGDFIARLMMAYADETLEKFEKSETRPPKWKKPTLKMDAGDSHTLHIKIFYWGVRRMIWNVIDAQISGDATGSP